MYIRVPTGLLSGISGCQAGPQWCIVFDIMGLRDFIGKWQVFFVLTKEKVVLFTSFSFFLPLPTYFVAGAGLIPAFYTAVIFFAFIGPNVSGNDFFLPALYVALVPLITYTLVCFIAQKISNKKWLWGMALGLVLLSLLLRIYVISDVQGVRHYYSATELYGEIF